MNFFYASYGCQICFETLNLGIISFLLSLTFFQISPEQIMLESSAWAQIKAFGSLYYRRQIEASLFDHDQWCLHSKMIVSRVSECKFYLLMDFCLSNPITIVQFKINAKSITIVKDQMSSNYLQVFISKLVISSWV